MERRRRVAAKLVDPLGSRPFACPGFGQKQHRNLVLGKLPDHCFDRPHAWAKGTEEPRFTLRGWRTQSR